MSIVLASLVDTGVLLSDLSSIFTGVELTITKVSSSVDVSSVGLTLTVDDGIVEGRSDLSEDLLLLLSVGSVSPSLEGMTDWILLGDTSVLGRFVALVVDESTVM